MKIYKYDFPTSGQMAQQPEQQVRAGLKAEHHLDYDKLDKIEVSAVSLPMHASPVHKSWDRSASRAESPKSQYHNKGMSRVGSMIMRQSDSMPGGLNENSDYKPNRPIIEKPTFVGKVTA